MLILVWKESKQDQVHILKKTLQKFSNTSANNNVLSDSNGIQTQNHLVCKLAK